MKPPRARRRSAEARLTTRIWPAIVLGFGALAVMPQTNAKAQAIDAPVTSNRVRATEPVLELVNGRWYTGRDFEARTFFVVNGVLRSQRPAQVDAVLDLAGGFAVPPFGDAHTHRPASPERASAGSDWFLAAGIYYVMNHGNLARYREALGRSLNRPDTIEALFANALIASPQSHGVELWQRLVGRGAFPGVEVKALEGDAYFLVESRHGIERAWPRILETRPDFIKLMIEYSEEYASRKDDPAYFGRSGLAPALVAEIVLRAHEAGLRVSAHIETAADFHVAVTAGVDLIAHLPGYDIPIDDNLARYRIDPADAALAAERGTAVVTTTILSVDRADGEPARLERMQSVQRQNLRLLAEAGAPLAVGSDQFSANSVDEVMNLASLKVFDNRTLLHLLCRETPRIIYPDRRLGVLEDGAEASFLVLRENPMERLECIRDIALRMKDGIVLETANARAGKPVEES